MYILFRIITLLFDLYTLAILLQVLASWLLAARLRLPLWAYDALHVLERITAPVLNPIRRVIPPLAGLDLSPIVAIVLLQIVERLLLSLLL
ncbi:MAG: YggT family protein [Anaerolineae bacterium]|nr:YggT family protein [Anaerolineae bacterium]